MTKVMKVLLGIVLSFIFITISIGYAQLTDDLIVRGFVSLPKRPDVYITKVTGTEYFTTNAYSGTVLNGTLMASPQTITIEFCNRSEYDYIFDNVIYHGSDYDNAYITISTNLDNLNDAYASEKAKKVISKNGGTLTITATYTATTSFPDSGVGLQSIASYSFVLTSDYVDKAAVDAALARFAQILNTDGSYTRLAQNLDSPMSINTTLFGQILDRLGGAQNYDYPVVGNVGDSFFTNDSADVDYVTEIFTDANGENHLTLIGENGEAVYVTALIQGVDSDNDGTYDIMMLYLTPVDVGNRDKTIDPVYLAFFTLNESTGKWAQVGELHEGTAKGCRYSTAQDYSGWTAAWLGVGNNSFDPDSWVSKSGTTRNDLLTQAIVAE